MKPVWQPLQQLVQARFGGFSGPVDLALAAWCLKAHVWLPPNGPAALREWWAFLCASLEGRLETAVADDRGVLLGAAVCEPETGEPTTAWVHVLQPSRLLSWALDDYGAADRWLLLQMDDGLPGPLELRALSPRLGLRLRAEDTAEETGSMTWADAMAFPESSEVPRCAIDRDAILARARDFALSEDCSALWRTWVDRIQKHQELDGGDDPMLPVWVLRFSRVLAALDGSEQVNPEHLKRAVGPVAEARLSLRPQAYIDGSTVRGIVGALRP